MEAIGLLYCFQFSCQVNRRLLSDSKYFFSVYPSELHLIYCALMLSLSISKYPTTFSLCYSPARFSPLWSHVHNTCPDIYTFYTTSYLPWNLTCKIIEASNDLIILRFSFSIWSNFVWQSLNANAELDL